MEDVRHAGDAPYVVVGAGQAGLQVCDSLRRAGYAGPLVLVGDEPELPYQRPPLSKKYLTGDVEDARLLFRPANFFEKNAIETRLGVRVTVLDRERRALSLEDGTALPYARLALTTGTRVRPLPVPGAELDGVVYVRSLADGRTLRERLARAERLVVVGGGFIGLEVAAIGRTLGKRVVVVEALERLMARAVSPRVSDYYAALHREHGVDVRLGTGVAAVHAAGAALEVETSDGQHLSADLVVAGIGVVPNVELAQAAGLECRNGIVVDVHARTSDPDIVAAGDCTMHFNGFLEREFRLESVQNAVDQAKVAALTLCGQDASYRQVPWFWSDQYDQKLQMAGIGMPHDEAVVRGEIGRDGFSVFYFRDGTLVGADSVNRPAEHMACRKLLDAGVRLTPAQAGDAGFDLMLAARAG